MLNWYFLGIIAATFFALEALITRYVSKFVSPEIIASSYFLFGFIFTFIYTLFSQKLEIGKIFPYLPFLLLLGIMGGIAILLMFASYKLAPNLGYVRAIISFSIVLAYLLSFPLFGAKFNIYGLLGIILIILGTLLFIKVG